MIRMTGISTCKPPVRLSERQRVTTEELLHWVYGKQLAHKIQNRGVGMHTIERLASGIDVGATSGDGCWQVFRNMVLGCTVSGGGMGTGDLHPDAELVHAEVARLEWAGLLISYGYTDDHPDWMPGAKAKVQPRRRENGKIMRIYDENNHVIGSQVEYVVLQENIDFARQVYWLWWASVRKLTDALEPKADMLTSYVVTGMRATEAPWIKAA